MATRWLAFAFGFPPLAARDLVVSPDGPYKTILEAVGEAKEGDSIYVKAGRYLESKSVVVSRAVRILGDDPRTVQVIGPQGAAATFLVDGARAVHLDGLGIQAPATAGAAAVAVRGGSATITHCVLRAGSANIGVDLGPTPKGSLATAIVNCVLHGSPLGTIALRASKCPPPLVRNAIFFQAKTALSLGDVGAELSYNDFYQCADVTQPPPGNYAGLQPGFANAGEWDYRLSAQAQSQCFDKGHPADAYKDALADAGGTERCDLGRTGDPPPGFSRRTCRRSIRSPRRLDRARLRSTSLSP